MNLQLSRKSAIDRSWQSFLKATDHVGFGANLILQQVQGMETGNSPGAVICINKTRRYGYYCSSHGSLRALHLL